MSSKKLPAFQWYPGDWRKDVGVQAASYEVRGVWVECLMLMHESEDRGKLVLNGRPMSDGAIARTLGLPVEKWVRVRAEILELGIASEDEDGALLNRRMVRDEHLRRARAEAGRKGGQANSGQARPEQGPSKPPSKPKGPQPLRENGISQAGPSKREANGKQNGPPSVSPSPSVSVSSSPPPSSPSPGGRMDGETFRRAKAALVQHCLLGSELGADGNGQAVGVGLLIRQFQERVAKGYDVDELLGAIANVRGDESAPPPSAAFSLRWFDADPGRWSRCVGAWRKRAGTIVPLPTVNRISPPAPPPDLQAEARRKLALARAEEAA